nr:PIN domain-containing protein [Candidatus Freyarchaeota archaeon]
MGELKAFVDTNVILNHLEGNVDLSKIRDKFVLCSNAIVFSEAFLVYLKAMTGKKSYELKRNAKLIVEKKEELEELFMLFEILKSWRLTEILEI